MYAQIRHMRVKAAERRTVPGRGDYYDVELTDGKNELYLNDVGISAGPIRVGGLFRVTVEPMNEARAR